MDVLTKAAVDSLKTVLPKIENILDSFESQPDYKKTLYDINEGVELLTILCKWIQEKKDIEDSKILEKKPDSRQKGHWRQ